MNTYYVYAYIRYKSSSTAIAGTPYYIGKGKEDRAWSSNHNVNLPKYKSLIVILENNLTEVGALALERRYIRWWGRKDTNTGILENKTDGGDGGTGNVPTAEMRRKMSEASKGKPKSEKHRLSLSKANKNKRPEDNSMYGKKHTAETKNKIKLARAKQNISDLTRKKMSESQKERYRLKKNNDF